MLTINRRQWDLLAECAERAFEAQALQHVKTYWTEECEALGEQGTRELVTAAVRRAKTYGLDAEYDILRYLNVAFALGSDFDRNPNLVWAVRILRDNSIGASARMDVLCSRTQEVLNETRADDRGVA